MYRNEADQPGFEVIVGGGQGRTPVIGKTIREWIEPQHVISYIEAILRIYNMYGRRDNIFKARIKILVNALGIDRFREMVDAEWAEIRDSELQIAQAEIDRINTYFEPPAYENIEDRSAEIDMLRQGDRAFDAWCRSNVAEHKVAGLCDR